MSDTVDTDHAIVRLDAVEVLFEPTTHPRVGSLAILPCTLQIAENGSQIPAIALVDDRDATVHTPMLAMRIRDARQLAAALLRASADAARTFEAQRAASALAAAVPE
jgi:hypothetical protein